MTPADLIRAHGGLVLGALPDTDRKRAAAGERDD